MKVTLGEAGLKLSWQKEFPKTTECCRCKGVARIGFVCHEGLPEREEGPFVCSLHTNGGKGDFWLHDCCAVAVYFCKECLSPTAIYNQG